MEEAITTKVRRQKVHSGRYRAGLHNDFPVIRIGGKFMKRLNFEIGDAIEVTYEKNRITVVKVSVDEIKNVQKPDRS